MRWSKKHELVRPIEKSSDHRRFASVLSTQEQQQSSSTRSTDAALSVPKSSGHASSGPQDFFNLLQRTTNNDLTIRPVAPSGSSDAGASRISQSLLHLPTSLIEYWFSHVCPIWSTFDSDVNYKRQIATIYCTSSEVVSTVLQTMSAACLLSSNPSLRDHFGSLEGQAGNAIVQRLSGIHAEPQTVASKVTTDLIFAIIALGTSLHWARPSRHDIILYTSARSLMDHWDASSDTDNPLHLAFFRQALTYWEMLLSVSGRGTTNSNVAWRFGRLQDRRRFPSGQQETDAGHLLHPHARHASSRGTRPNSSCGLSSEVVGLFAQVLALCRSAHERQKCDLSAATLGTDKAASRLAIARDLQRELLNLDFQEVVHTDERLGFSLHTGDDSTPLDHHIHVAEAYRLAGLLHILLSFPETIDPEIAELIDGSFTPKTKNVADWSRTVAAQLIKTLKYVPFDSGIRCMLPVLYISAATGLSYPSMESWVLGFTASNLDALDGSTVSHIQEPGVANIRELRQTVLDRLKTLQRTLPLRPVATAIDLVKAIWTAYDASGSSSHKVHWLDVMEDARFQTLFC